MTSATDGTVRHDYDLLVIGSGPGRQTAARRSPRRTKVAALDATNKIRALQSFG